MKLLNVLVACFTLMMATACDHKSNDDPMPETKADHTLLIYIAGDNSLSSNCKDNIKLMKKGLLNSPDDINLLIYKDNRDTGDGLPVLFQLKRTYDKKTNAAKIDTVYIQRYTQDLNSCDPSVMAEVVNTAFKSFNTTVKGMELWSHGLSWIPSYQFQPSTRYIGQDNNNFLELWDIRKALEQCPKLDYISFDACFTGMAEVAHELDGVCDYIYGPITEIMSFGFPYDTMLPILASCKNKTSVERTLVECVDDFSKSSSFDGYGYTITLLKTEKADDLATAVAKLRKASGIKLTELSANPKAYEARMQHYGRAVVGTRYVFYDLADYVDYMAEDGDANIQAILSEINSNNIVVAYANSPYFSDGGLEKINLSGCKGLGVSIPEFFGLTSQQEKLTVCYELTKWGRKVMNGV